MKETNASLRKLPNSQGVLGLHTKELGVQPFFHVIPFFFSFGERYSQFKRIVVSISTNVVAVFSLIR